MGDLALYACWHKIFCLFGCQDQLDSMNHYIHCPFWLFLLSKTTLDSKPSPSSCPLTRLGLVDPSEDSLKSVACSFAAYHAVKRSLTHQFLTSAPLCGDQILSSHRVFWDSYCTAARDCELSHRAFSRIVAKSRPGVSDTPEFSTPLANST